MQLLAGSPPGRLRHLDGVQQIGSSFRTNIVPFVLGFKRNRLALKVGFRGIAEQTANTPASDSPNHTPQNAFTALSEYRSEWSNRLVTRRNFPSIRVSGTAILRLEGVYYSALKKSTTKRETSLRLFEIATISD
jgi:hypothetical protein